MRVFIPTPLRSYTDGKGEVQGVGRNLLELLSGMDKSYPGLRFRVVDEQDGIRQHIKIFVNREQAQSLREPLDDNDEVHIICALSGGNSRN